MFEMAFALARPLLAALGPERAHELTLRSLQMGIHPRSAAHDDSRLAASVWGLTFANPLGIAAGFDKDARVIPAVLGMGLGYAEVGTLTPRPQAGNPRPRIFRLNADHALINRLGFNNGGHATALARLVRDSTRGIVGVNVGANKDAPDRAADYVQGIHCFYDVARYFCVNISSPNTPGLRDLQAPRALDDLLGRVLAGRSQAIAAGKPRRPIVVKIAPDIAEADLEPIVAVLIDRAIDGIAIGNTTLSRAGVSDTAAGRELGGLSGRPLFHRSTVMLARVYRLTHGRVPLIGIGGIDSGSTAIAKIEAGATLLQFYTGLVFEGPGLIDRIKRALVDYAERQKLARIGDAVGISAGGWANRPLEA
jgi:dihydroorotate dehydrogenase